MYVYKMPPHVNNLEFTILPYWGKLGIFFYPVSPLQVSVLHIFIKIKSTYCFEVEF